MKKVLIVRLGALGDLIHALPAVAALRGAFPDARIDWLVDARHREVLDLVPMVDHRIVWRSPGVGGWGGALRTIGELRAVRYDVAIDLQGLLKSAILARISGASRVIGFPSGLLRERAARLFYSEAGEPVPNRHVIDKNLTLARVAGARDVQRSFPLTIPASRVPAVICGSLGLGEQDPFAVINPGAAWPNKRWPPERFGAVAAALWEIHGLRSVVLWGPGEEALARRVTSASRGAAVVAPPTTINDLVAVIASASLMLSGDTGPLHIGAAVGTPLVGLYGPTDPVRNGPWSPADVSISRFADCSCHHKRRCEREAWCLGDIRAEQVIEAVSKRLAARPVHA